MHDQRASEAGPGTAPSQWLERTRERSRLGWHPVEHAQRATVVWPVVSAQWPTDGKVLSHGIMATPRISQTRKCGCKALEQDGDVVSGGSSGLESRPRLGKLLRGGWVLRDLPRKKAGGWLGLATVSRSQK
jgi:hypothetical protein